MAKGNKKEKTNLKKYILLYQGEFFEDHEWEIQFSTDDLEEARKEKEEMLDDCNIEKCVIVEFKVIE